MNYSTGGFQYKGNWKNDKKHGRGAWKSKDQQIIYTGEFKDGLKHGENCTWENLEDSTSYTGVFKLGSRHGYGEYRNERARSYYRGEWKHGLKHGIGTEGLASGDLYRGRFE